MAQTKFQQLSHDEKGEFIAAWSEIYRQGPTCPASPTDEQFDDLADLELHYRDKAREYRNQ